MLLPLTLPAAETALPGAGAAMSAEGDVAAFGAALDEALDGQGSGDPSIEAGAVDAASEEAVASAPAEIHELPVAADAVRQCVIVLPVVPGATPGAPAAEAEAADLPEEIGSNAAEDEGEGSAASAAVAPQVPDQMNVAAEMSAAVAQTATGNARPAPAQDEESSASQGATSVKGSRENTARSVFTAVAEQPSEAPTAPSTASARSTADAPVEEASPEEEAVIAPQAARAVPSESRAAGKPERALGQRSAEPVEAPPASVAQMPSESAADAAARPIRAVPSAVGARSANVTDVDSKGASPALDLAQDQATIDAEIHEAVTPAASSSATGDGASNEHEQSSHGGARADAAPAARASASATPMMLVQSADGTLRLAHVAAAPQQTMSALTEEERAENGSRLVQTMRVLTKDGISEATLRLRPEHLGEVSIAIKVEGKTVTATVQAESANVREWLQSQEETLRSNLSQQGLNLDRLQVQRDPRHDRRGHADQQQQQQRPRYRRAEDGAEARFEVTV